jgi:hypothetical protein
MARLKVELRDGFRDDEVVVHVAGRPVLHERGVQEDPRISFSRAGEVEVPDEPVDVEVAVPTRGLTERVEVDPERHRYLAAWIDGSGRLILEPTAEQQYML